MAVLRIDDIGPDGVRMVINWSLMKTGDSIFVPCINTTKCIKQVRAIFDRRQWQMRVKITIERNILGVRIWRTA